MVVVDVRRPACTEGTPSVARWYDQTVAAVAGLPDPLAERVWATAWTAADLATSAGPHPDDALAGAVSGVLRELVPERRKADARALERSCTGTPAFRRGRTAAADVLAQRRDDGLSAGDLDGAVALPSPAAGVWRPTPPDRAPAGSAGLARARPFAATADLRAPAPAPLGSPRYRADLAEVRLLGEAGSTRRTPEQTATALFWAPSPVALWAAVVRPAVVRLDARRAAAVVAPLHRATLDALLAVYRDKYRDPRWRPVTALQEDGDGDPTTPRVPGWLPLVETPPNPEHPSGHCAYAAAAATVLERRLGDVPVTLDGRSWTGWEQLVRENEDARVWAGVHLRGSDEDGTVLGRSVARVVLTPVLPPGASSTRAPALPADPRGAVGGTVPGPPAG